MYREKVRLRVERKVQWNLREQKRGGLGRLRGTHKRRTQEFLEFLETRRDDSTN